MWLSVTAPNSATSYQRIKLEPGLTVSSFTRYVPVASPPRRRPRIMESDRGLDGGSGGDLPLRVTLVCWKSMYS